MTDAVIAVAHWLETAEALDEQVWSTRCGAPNTVGAPRHPVRCLLEKGHEGMHHAEYRPPLFAHTVDWSDVQ